MSSLNKVALLGRLGQDPELKYMQDGKALANLSIATSEQWKDKQTGAKQEKTEWHRVTIWGKLAEIVGQYCSKGSQIYVEGKLQTRKWTDKDGNDRYTTEVVLTGFDSKLILLGGGKNNGQNQAPRPQAAAPAEVAGQMGGGASQWFPQDSGKQTAPVQEDFEDDIPF